MKRKKKPPRKIPYKLYFYLQKESGKVIAIRSKQVPRPKYYMRVVREWDVESGKFRIMACFPEITNDLLFSDKFLPIGHILAD